MLIKIRPKRGTIYHVHDRKKYIPGAILTVADLLGEELVRNRIADKMEEPKRGPGRPRKFRRI